MWLTIIVYSLSANCYYFNGKLEKTVLNANNKQIYLLTYNEQTNNRNLINIDIYSTNKLEITKQSRLK